MKIIGVIPVRMGSSRFPGKPLFTIAGMPMLEHVWHRANMYSFWDELFLATCDQEIQEFANLKNIPCIMTSDKHERALDRVAEAVGKSNVQINDDDIVLNVQGDEPMVNPDTILKVIEEKKKFPKSVITSISRFNSNKEFKNRNIVKFVFDNEKNLLYTSRSGIPGNKNDEFIFGYNHVAVYAFNKKELESFYRRGIENGKTELEWVEDIEILRFLEMNYNVKIVEVSDVGWSVDIPSDVEKVEDVISERL